MQGEVRYVLDCSVNGQIAIRYVSDFSVTGQLAVGYEANLLCNWERCGMFCVGM